MQVQNHVVLNHVGTPLKILFWTIPEMLILLVPFFSGLVCNQMLFGVLASGLGYFGYSKYQKIFGKGQFDAVRYWFLPSGSRFKLPLSHIRDYLG